MVDVPRSASPQPAVEDLVRAGLTTAAQAPIRARAPVADVASDKDSSSDDDSSDEDVPLAQLQPQAVARGAQ